MFGCTTSALDNSFKGRMQWHRAPDPCSWPGVTAGAVLCNACYNGYRYHAAKPGRTLQRSEWASDKRRAVSGASVDTLAIRPSNPTVSVVSKVSSPRRILDAQLPTPENALDCEPSSQGGAAANSSPPGSGAGSSQGGPAARPASGTGVPEKQLAVEEPVAFPAAEDAQGRELAESVTRIEEPMLTADTLPSSPIPPSVLMVAPTAAGVLLVEAASAVVVADAAPLEASSAVPDASSRWAAQPCGACGGAITGKQTTRREATSISLGCGMQLRYRQWVYHCASCTRMECPDCRRVTTHGTSTRGNSSSGAATGRAPGDLGIRSITPTTTPTPAGKHQQPHASTGTIRSLSPPAKRLRFWRNSSSTSSTSSTARPPGAA